MRVIISAGGTGGHIYPALAMINKIKLEEPKSEFLYIGTHNRMEKDLVPAAGIKYEALTILGFKRKLTLANMKTMVYFVKAYYRAKKIIREFKPDIVLGFGGYVTGPVLLGASRLGYPTLVHEQNSILGLTNRFLMRFVDRIAISFPYLFNYQLPHQKIVLTGNPCSEEILTVKPLVKRKLGLSSKKKLVVMVMGSLGSSTVNEKMKAILPLFKDKSYEVLLITGTQGIDAFQGVKLSSNVQVRPYIKEFKELLRVTTVMVSRAGATTISQIMALQIPTIFIPSPYVVNNHQTKNAQILVEQEAALLLAEADLSGKRLVQMIDELINNQAYYQRYQEHLKGMVPIDSASKIYQLVCTLVDGSK